MVSSLNKGILNQEFQSYLTEEINREATLLNLVQKLAERKSTVEWTANMGGTKVEGVAITASAPAASSDKVVPAMLPINSGSIQSAFTLNSKEIVEAAEMVSPQELRNLLRSHMSLAVDEMLHTLSRNCYNGNGSVVDGGIYGLDEAVSDTKDYAGISASQYPLWRSVVVDKWDENASGADKRQPLTTDDFHALERQMRYRPGRYDIIVTTPKVVEVYKKIFEANRSYNVYVTERGMIPTVDLGFSALSYAGKPIIDDAFCIRKRDAAEDAIALGDDDEGVIYFLKLSDLEFMSVPTPGSSSKSGVYTQMEQLAKNSLYVDRYVVGCIPQLKLKTRKNTGMIKNIAVA